MLQPYYISQIFHILRFAEHVSGYLAYGPGTVTLIFKKSKKQRCGSVTFWYGSGYPYLLRIRIRLRIRILVFSSVTFYIFYFGYYVLKLHLHHF
jgi:hypothetical protein